MKAIYFTQHGGPEVLRYGDRPTPTPGDDQVLIQVCAAGVNPRDWQFRDGTYAFRHLSGRLPIIPGSDVSGIVVQRGRRVTDFAVGDEVFAMQTTLGRMGGYAEYTAVRADVVAHKPPSVSHVEAAAVPVAGLTAWQALHEQAKVTSGSRVVIVGASGGVGHYAVQFARHAGATVTAVCGPRNVEWVRSLGAHEIVDYSRQRFTDLARDQDAVFDTIGRESLASSAAILSGDGVYLTTNPTVRAAKEWLGTTVVHRLRGGRRAQLVLVRPKAKDLRSIAALMAAGHIRSAVDAVYPLPRAGDALDRSRSRHTRGKLVLTVR